MRAACGVRRGAPVWMGLIFFMSANDGDHSQGMSDGVTSVVLSTVWPGYSGMSPDEQAAVVESLSFPVRKAGHFSEYAVLGLLALRDTSPGSGASVFPGDSDHAEDRPCGGGRGGYRLRIRLLR